MNGKLGFLTHTRSVALSLVSLALGCSSAGPAGKPDAPPPVSVNTVQLDAGVDAMIPLDAPNTQSPDARPAATDADGHSPDPMLPPIVGKAQAVLQHADGRWLRIQPTAGAVFEDLSKALTQLSDGEAGQDDIISVSSDAGWLVMTTSRFGCSSTGCIAIVKSDLSLPGVLVKPLGNEITSAGRPVIAAGGALVVFEMAGPHEMDLFATTLKNGAWTKPLLLTAMSTHPFNHDPALSPDGSKVAFDCGGDPYGDTAGTEPCEAMTDGSGVEVLFPLSSLPGATALGYTQRPTYMADGSVVFEGNPAGENEQVYRFVRGGTPALVGNGFTDDNSPCALRDGRILSFWLGRPANTDSLHELKVMNADGSHDSMLITLENLADIGISCGG